MSMQSGPAIVGISLKSPATLTLMTVAILVAIPALVSLGDTTPVTTPLLLRHNAMAANEAQERPLCANNLNGTQLQEEEEIGSLHVIPAGGLANRLRAISSGLAAGRKLGVNVTFSPNEKRKYFVGHLDRYFSEPKVTWKEYTNMTQRTCPSVKFPVEFFAPQVAKGWVDRGCRDILCVSSFMTFMGVNAWFYALLKLSAKLENAITTFQDQNDWHEWGTWIAIHMRRTDLGIVTRNVTGNGELVHVKARDTIKVEWYADMAFRIAKLCKDKPRFIVATDDPAAEKELWREMMNAGYSTESKNLIACPKTTRDKLGDDVFATRSETTGIEEAVIDMFLLSKAKLLIGTVYSTFGDAISLMGDIPMIRIVPFVGFHEEIYKEMEPDLIEALAGDKKSER